MTGPTSIHTSPDQAAADLAFEAAQISPWSTKEKLARALWMLFGSLLFRISFHTWHPYRRAILRLFGATIGRSCYIRPSAHIEIPWNLTMLDYASLGDRAIVYNLGPITIGRRTTISQGAHLCAGTHDYTNPAMPLIRPTITIGDDCWIAADAFVGPGVAVANGAILGARACAFKDVPPWSIFGGNPARKIADRPPFRTQGPTP